MAQMSAKFKEMGENVYLDAEKGKGERSDVVRSATLSPRSQFVMTRLDPGIHRKKKGRAKNPAFC